MNYYNEYDPYAATWLRELIAYGAIPNGHVDTRSIRDVQPSDLSGYTQCHFFAGIGGWPYALRLANWDPARPVWTGSCPCQPFSVAGKGLGTKDERHLWPEMFRLIRECRPATVFGEQVASKAGREWLSGVFTDLEGVGYAAAGADLCAAGVGAPHIRQRLWWVAQSRFEQARRGVCRSDESTATRSGGTPDKPGRSGSTRTGGLLDTDGSGSQPRRQAAEAARHRCSTESAGGTCGIPHTGSAGSPEFVGRRDQPERLATPVCACGLQHAKCDGRIERRAESIGRGIERGCGWSDFDILPFRDGKQRRVESGTFPLAHGIPGRVGLLRGYGNAIVPQVAQAFIEAFVDVTSSQ